MRTTFHPTKNPFSNLTVEIDEEISNDLDKLDERYLTTQSTLDNKIKKKVRPEEIQKLTQKQQVSEMPSGVVNAQGDDFIEVIKRDKNAKELFNENWFPDEMNKKESIIPHQENWTIPKRSKRLFDRHSRSGRGREIPKHGAGGKTTWGDIDQYAKQESLNYEADYRQKFYYNLGDESYFKSALKEKQVEEDKQDNEAPEEIFIESLDTYENENRNVKIDHIDSKKEVKRRKKAGQVEEQTKEEHLDRPENAITYQEYLVEMNKKNEILKDNKVKQTPHEVINQSILKVPYMGGEDLQYQKLLNDKNIKKKSEKIKERISDEQIEHLNRLISDNLSISNQEKKYDKPSYYKNRDYQYNKGSDTKTPVEQFEQIGLRIHRMLEKQ